MAGRARTKTSRLSPRLNPRTEATPGHDNLFRWTVPGVKRYRFSFCNVARDGLDHVNFSYYVHRAYRRRPRPLHKMQGRLAAQVPVLARQITGCFKHDDLGASVTTSKAAREPTTIFVHLVPKVFSKGLGLYEDTSSLLVRDGDPGRDR
jgi:hypothetical protein